MPRKSKRSRAATKRVLDRKQREIGYMYMYISPPESIWIEHLSLEQPPPEAGTAMVMECEEVELECYETVDEEHLMTDIQEDTTTDQAQVTDTQDIETTGGKGNQAQATDMQDNELDEIKAIEQGAQVTEVQGIGSTEDELTKAKINDQDKVGVADILEMNLEEYEIYINEDTEHEAIQDREQFTCTIKQETMNPDYVCDEMNPDYVCDKMEEGLVCLSSEAELVTLKQEEADFSSESGNVLYASKQEEADFCSGSGNVLHASKQVKADFCSESSVFACGADSSQEHLITQGVGIEIEPDMQFPCSSLMTGMQAVVSVREESGEGGNEVKTQLDTADHLPSGTTSPTSPPANKWNKSTAVSDLDMEYGTSCSQTQTKSFTDIDKRKRTRSRMEKADDYIESAKISSVKSLSDNESRRGNKVLNVPLILKRGCRLNNAVKETSVSKSVCVPSVYDKNERNIRYETNLPGDKYCTGRFQKKYMLYNEIDEKKKERIIEMVIRGLNLSPEVSGESKTSVEKNKSLSKRTSLYKDCEELNNCIRPCRSENLVNSVETIYMHPDAKTDKTRCYINYRGISESVETQTELQKLEKPHQKVMSGTQHQDNIHDPEVLVLSNTCRRKDKTVSPSSGLVKGLDSRQIQLFDSSVRPQTIKIYQTDLNLLQMFVEQNN